LYFFIFLRFFIFFLFGMDSDNIVLEHLLRNHLFPAAEAFRMSLSSEKLESMLSSKRLETLFSLMTLESYIEHNDWSEDVLNHSRDLFENNRGAASFYEKFYATVISELLFVHLRHSNPEISKFQKAKQHFLDKDNSGFALIQVLKKDVEELQESILQFDKEPKRGRKTISKLLEKKYAKADSTALLIQCLDEYRNSLQPSIIDRVTMDIASGYRPGSFVRKAEIAKDVIVPVEKLRDQLGPDFAAVYSGKDPEVQTFIQQRKRKRVDEHAEEGGVFDNYHASGDDVSEGENVNGQNVVVPAELPTALGQRSPRKKTATGRGRVRWTPEEVEKLIEGVASRAEGKWAEILTLYDFGDRTAVDLKDKWRNIKERDPEGVAKRVKELRSKE